MPDWVESYCRAGYEMNLNPLPFLRGVMPHLVWEFREYRDESDLQKYKDGRYVPTRAELSQPPWQVLFAEIGGSYATYAGLMRVCRRSELDQHQAPKDNRQANDPRN